MLAAFAAGTSATPALAQRLPITTYTTRDGLPHYVINRIVGDSHGFLWFCTREGLARFDGRDFVRFGTEQGLPSATVNSLVETRDGTYWVATSAGLAHLDPRRRPLFTTHAVGQDPRAANVAALAVDPSGDVWVGTAAGLYRARATAPGGVELTYVDLRLADRLQARGIASLLVDRAGALWIGAGGGLFRRSGDQAIEVLGPPDGLASLPVAATDILEDRAGRIWLGTMMGLHRVAGPEGLRKVSAVRGGDDALVGSAIWSLLEDSRGVMWAATSAGLLRITVGQGATLEGVRAIGEGEGLPTRLVQALAEDTHGNIWVGVNPYGVARLSPTGFTSFDLPVPRTFPSTLLETNDGRLLVVGMAAGRWATSAFDGQRFRSIAGARPEGTPSWGWNQLALQDRSGSWWFGTNEGLVRYAPGIAIANLARARPVARYTRADGLSADVVIRLFEDTAGDVWISTVGHGMRPNGLSVWRRRPPHALVHFSERDGLPPLDRYYASSFASDRGGHVWVGFSGDAGLVRHEGGAFRRFTSRDGVPQGQIRNFLADSSGRLWAATYRSGLCRIDQPEGPTPRFSAYTTADGLSSNETHALVEATNGDLYIGTARGLDRLAAATGRWTHHTSHDGLPAGEMQGAFRDRHGTLWFTYNDAVLRLLPEPERTPRVPRVFITGINVGGREVPVSAVGEQQPAGLEVPSGVPVRIEFAAPWFAAPGDISYQYQLRDADRDWSRPSDQRSVTYVSMEPGSHAFTVRASANGVAAPAAATLALAVVPPVWRRPVFLVAAACIAGLLAYAAYRVRLGRMLEFANMRTRIATDLHDDLGANLTRIGILSEVVRHELGTRALPDDSRLASIARLARDSIGAMSDIVWTINPERDSLVDLARKIRDVSEDVAAAAGIELDVSLPDAEDGLRLDMDVRRDLFLICKEALNNAARHSECRHLRVGLRHERVGLALDVVDDGVGFEPGRDEEGNGLVSMRRRAARIGATLTVDSAPERGTAVRVHLPMSRRRPAQAPTRRSR